MLNKTRDSITFRELNWDTEYFGISSAKAILHNPLDFRDWEKLKTKFENYQFVSIENCNSEPINSQHIGRDTAAFLADVNIQFKKVPEYRNILQRNIEINNAVDNELDNKITEIAEFKFSKFVEDPELVRRGGKYVYQQWIISSFGNRNKYFAVSKDYNNEINGFSLFSYQDNSCVIELLAVSENEKRGGIGTSLFRSVEDEACKNGCTEIRVGTQVRNLDAINFYHKVGCKQVGCNQIFHLWHV